MNTNINQIFQKVLKNLSLASISLGVFNTLTNQTTVQTLRDKLEVEKDKNSKLIEKVNNLVSENESNSKIENIIRKSFENNDNKIELLNNKVNKLIENKSFEENKIIEINNNIKDINNDLEDIITKIDDTLRSGIIDFDIFQILHDMQSFYSSLNYFQCLALTHLSAIVFIFLSLTSLISIHFGDYLTNKFNVKNKYPRIYKFIELRRKFQLFYLIKDLIIIFIVLIILSYINVMLFINFTL